MSKPAPKTFLLSKTFWLNLVALAALVAPQVQVWLAENPVEILAVLSAANIILRFVTKGAVTFFPDGNDEDNNASGGGSGGGLLPLAILCSGAAFLLPSCAATGYPLTGSVFWQADSGAKVGIVYRGK